MTRTGSGNGWSRDRIREANFVPHQKLDEMEPIKLIKHVDLVASHIRTKPEAD